MLPRTGAAVLAYVRYLNKSSVLQIDRDPGLQEPLAAIALGLGWAGMCSFQISQKVIRLGAPLEARGGRSWLH